MIPPILKIYVFVNKLIHTLITKNKYFNNIKTMNLIFNYVPAIKRIGFKKVNLLAYVGLMGDVAVMTAIYLYVVQRRKINERKPKGMSPLELKMVSESYPPRTESIDYYKMNPYTPIPYFVDDNTKIQTHHIDLLNYFDPTKQYHLKNFYYANYFDGLDHNESHVWENDFHEPNINRWVPGASPSHSHNHGSHGHH
jgi:hypothetical protein